jgi:hypothetical protein
MIPCDSCTQTPPMPRCRGCSRKKRTALAGLNKVRRTQDAEKKTHVVFGKSLPLFASLASFAVEEIKGTTKGTKGREGNYLYSQTVTFCPSSRPFYLHDKNAKEWLPPKTRSTPEP